MNGDIHVRFCEKLGLKLPLLTRQAKYGGMEVSDVKKMKDMEAEISQYKKIVAELTFENRAIKAFLEKK